MILEQLFDVFRGTGRCHICIGEPSPDERKDFKEASFYLVMDNQILYKFPYHFETMFQ